MIFGLSVIIAHVCACDVIILQSAIGSCFIWSHSNGMQQRRDSVSAIDRVNFSIRRDVRPRSVAAG